MTHVSWKPGEPCPSCGTAGQIKFNGGNPLCLACGEYVPGPPRLTKTGTRLYDGEDEPETRPFCDACSHHHDADEPCRCPECGQPAREPGGTCGRPHA